MRCHRLSTSGFVAASVEPNQTAFTTTDGPVQSIPRAVSDNAHYVSSERTACSCRSRTSDTRSPTVRNRRGSGVIVL